MRACAIAIASAVMLAGCPGNGKSGGASTGGTPFTVFALAEIRGQIEPCGCTTDPLGDLARTAQLVAEARARGPVLVVDAGNLLYTQATLPEHMKAQEELKADLLAAAYRDELQVTALGLGPNDLSGGPEKVRLPRQVANVAPTGAPFAIEAPKVVKVGGEQIGVFGVAETGLLGASDATEAAKAAVASLRQRGATRVIGVATMPRKAAVELVRATPGIDLMVVGLGLSAPEPDQVGRAERVGDTWMVFPANRGQVVARFDVTLRPGGGALVDAIGADAAVERKRAIADKLALLDEELKRAAGDATADPAFVAQRRAERDGLAAERDALDKNPLRAPAKGSWFTLSNVRIAKALACDGDVVAAKQGYARAAGAVNVAAAKSQPPIPVPPGAATYVGTEACADCHQEAVDFWKTTRHVRAWDTLEEVGKPFDYDCIGCHVTGWGEPGGASMAVNESLRDVQCETCHGPGSKHVDADGDAEAKQTIVRVPAEGLCAGQCHTPEHSDTFDRVPYYRDVLGAGHGAKAREALGSGVTGRELRAAGLAKAGKDIGAGCPK